MNSELGMTWDTFLTSRGTQGWYLNNISEQCPLRFSKSVVVDGLVGGMLVAHKILVTTQSPNNLFSFKINSMALSVAHTFSKKFN